MITGKPSKPLLTCGGASNGLHLLDCGGPLLHQDPVPAVRTAYAAVLVIYLHSLFAAGALISHLLISLKSLLKRPQH